MAIADTAEQAEALLLHVDPLRQSVATAVPLEIGMGDSVTWLLAFVPREAKITAPKSLVHYAAEVYCNFG